MRVGVTGARGFVGSRIANYLERDHKIYRYGRYGSSTDDEIHFELGKEIDFGRTKLDVLVHCAYDFSLSRWQDIERVNVRGSSLLFDSVRRAGVDKMVFISTLSAYENCQSLYGRAKMAIEKEAIELDAVIVRPGLVFGRNAGGMVGSLRKLVSKTPFIPLVDEGRQILYQCHFKDLAHLIELVIAKKDHPRGPVVAASEIGLRLKQILEILAEAEGKRVAFFSVPSAIVWSCLKLAEIARVPVGLRSDSLVSLSSLNPSIDFSYTRNIGAAFRRFDLKTVNEE